MLFLFHHPFIPGGRPLCFMADPADDAHPIVGDEEDAFRHLPDVYGLLFLFSS
jgi:hypothetical protein